MHGPSPILCDTAPSVFTLISYYAIVFSFDLMFIGGWFTQCAMAFCKVSA